LRELGSMRKKIILLVIILLCTGGLVYQHYTNTFQTITISSKNSFTFRLYPAIESESGNYDKSNPILTISRAGTYKVKKGLYIYVASGKDRDYAEISQQIRIGDTPATIPITLKYSSSKLSALLEIEYPKVLAALKEKYPSQMQLYNVEMAKLYENGEWCGIILTPKNNAAYDVLRAVLKKQNNAWRVVTDPPEIILSKPVYPSIPTDLLSDIDNFSSTE